MKKFENYVAVLLVLIGLFIVVFGFHQFFTITGANANSIRIAICSCFSGLGSAIFAGFIWRRECMKDRTIIELIPNAVALCSNGSHFFTSEKLHPNYKYSMVCFKVINHSVFPVSILQIGFTDKKCMNKYLLTTKKDFVEYENNPSIPVNINAKSFTLLYFDIKHLKSAVVDNSLQIRSGYVETGTNLMFTGKSKAFKELVQKIQFGEYD